MIVKKKLELATKFTKHKTDNTYIPLIRDLHSTYFYDKRFDPDDGTEYIIAKFGFHTYNLISNFIQDALDYAGVNDPSYTGHFYFSATLPIFTKHTREFCDDFYKIKCHLRIEFETLDEGNIELNIEFYEEESSIVKNKE